MALGVALGSVVMALLIGAIASMLKKKFQKGEASICDDPAAEKLNK